MSSWTGDRSGPVIVAALAVLTLMTWPLPADAAGFQPTPDNLRRARERLVQLETAFETAVEDYHEATLRLEALEARHAEAQARVEENEAQTALHLEAVGAVAGSLYRGVPLLEIGAILAADSTSAAAERIVYLSGVGRVRHERIQQLIVSREALAEDLEESEQARSETETQALHLADVKADVRRMANEQRDEVARLTAQLELFEEERRARRAAAEAAKAAAERANRDAGLPAAPSSPEPSADAEEFGTAAPDPQTSVEDPGQAAVAAALEQVDKPYQWDGNGPESFDASGLTQYAAAQVGMALPRGARAQFGETTRVNRQDLTPGDLVFFGSPIHHVGVYIGQEQMVHAPATATTVTVDSIDRRDYVGAGRLRFDDGIPPQVRGRAQ